MASRRSIHGPKEAENGRTTLPKNLIFQPLLYLPSESVRSPAEVQEVQACERQLVVPAGPSVRAGRGVRAEAAARRRATSGDENPGKPRKAGTLKEIKENPGGFRRPQGGPRRLQEVAGRLQGSSLQQLPGGLRRPPDGLRSSQEGLAGFRRPTVAPGGSTNGQEPKQKKSKKKPLFFVNPSKIDEFIG